MLGGESSLEQHLYSGRTMKKKPFPAAPHSHGPYALGALHPHRVGNRAAGSGELLASSSHTPTHLRKSVAAQPASLYPSIPPWSHGLTLQRHPQPSAATHQLLRHLLPAWHTAGSPSRELRANHHFQVV